MEILILDNYDSFTYNLVHLVEKVIDKKVTVKRNDEISLDEVNQFNKIILSPGPGLPSEAGMMPTLLRELSSSKNILGVCLGMQAIGEYSGAKLKNLSTVRHGAAEPIVHFQNDSLFQNIPVSFQVGRYHSWVVDETNLPEELLITAKDLEGNIMAIRHKTLKLKGIQFHPESILSEYGRELIENWALE